MTLVGQQVTPQAKPAIGDIKQAVRASCIILCGGRSAKKQDMKGEVWHQIGTLHHHRNLQPALL